MTNNVYLGLGSNEGDRMQNIRKAILELAALGTIEKIAGIWESKPWGNTEQGDFLNTALEVSTELEPERFLFECQEIERKLGRKRTGKWGPRIIDIDIIFWDQLKLESKSLSIPHPFWKDRAFVILPMDEIAPNFTPPDSERSIHDLSYDMLESGMKQVLPRLK
jgi:2-amino-4-hydroxy-6-hydroxymethyldihydropteridine diphosphokinase